MRGILVDTPKFAEVYRLAIEAQEQEIAQHVGGILVDCLMAVSRFREAAYLAETTLQLGSDARALHDLATCLDAIGEPSSAVELFRQAISECSTTDTMLVAKCNSGLGVAYSNLGKLDLASERHLVALSKYQQLGDPNGEAVCFNNLGHVSDRLGEYDAAADYLERSYELQKDNQPSAALILNNIGHIHASVGRYARALKYYERALPVLKSAENRKAEATVTRNIGYVHHSTGNFSLALEYYELALKISEEIGDRSGVATVVCNVGLTHHALRKYHDALSFYREALQINREIRNPQGIGSTHNNIGLAYEALGELDTAKKHYKIAVKTAVKTGALLDESIARFNLASVHSKQGHLTNAVIEMERVVEIDAAIGHSDLSRDSSILAFFKGQASGTLNYSNDTAMRRGTKSPFGKLN